MSTEIMEMPTLEKSMESEQNLEEKTVDYLIEQCQKIKDIEEATIKYDNIEDGIIKKDDIDNNDNDNDNNKHISVASEVKDIVQKTEELLEKLKDNADYNISNLSIQFKDFKDSFKIMITTNDGEALMEKTGNLQKALKSIKDQMMQKQEEQEKQAA